MAGKSVSSCGRPADSTYLDQGLLHYFRGRLLRWRDELCTRMQGRPDDGALHGLPDWLDSASLSTQVELSWADRERSLQIIRQIDAALERIESGTYGYCAESGEEIGVRRLMAMPIAQYSVETQSDIERRRQTGR